MCLPGAPADGHGELVFPAVDSTSRSVGAGRRNRPCFAGFGTAQAQGHPLDGSPAPLAVHGPHTACRARRRSRATGKQAPPWFPPPYRNPELDASGRESVYAPGDSAGPRPGHPLHPMIAGHATGQNTTATTAIAVPIVTAFELVIRGLPAGRRKPFSRPRPRRPKGPSLILSVARQDLAGAARLLCNFHACGPLPGSTPGSAEAQVLTFGMSSQRVV